LTDKGPYDNTIDVVKMTKGIVIAGLSGGSGKSVVAVGLTAALVRQGHRVVPFKKGPDYIDAGWLELAASEGCYNLDPYLMETERLLTSFRRHVRKAEMVLVEGNRGLYDGVHATGGYSTAELAHCLGLPVILVVNCTKTTRTIAALVLGCQKFDQQLSIAGVILNQVATERQRRLITNAVEHYTGIPVLGSVPRMGVDIFPMRHLGMIPHQEYQNCNAAIESLATLMGQHLNLDAVRAAMTEVDPGPQVKAPAPRKGKQDSTARIGIVRDSAFQFYYRDNLEALENQGAELVFLDAMSDTKLPQLDGLYIGGGFPETGARQLTANTSFRQAIKSAADDGLVIYAECGGLIYLGESILVDGQEYPLAGVFPVRFAMGEKPQAHGYSHFVVEGPNCCYPIGMEVKGHEFRYSTIVEWRGTERDLSIKMTRGTGFDGGRDGLVYNNVFALYTHVHAEATPEWASGFVASCRSRRRQGG
jgi:cobyrinic acid a,c-diamide synthase